MSKISGMIAMAVSTNAWPRRAQVGLRLAMPTVDLERRQLERSIAGV
jgi:hypothetical protein